jgi:hypothetical protein
MLPVMLDAKGVFADEIFSKLFNRAVHTFGFAFQGGFSPTD